MAKKLNVIGIVLAALVLVGLVLAIVGMFISVVSITASAGGASVTVTYKLFGDDLMKAAVESGAVSTTFTIIAFIVTLVGAVAVLVHGVLSLLGKDIKILGLAAGAVTVVGAILLLIAGFVLANQFISDLPEKMKDMYSALPGAGIWLGFIGGLVAGVAGLLSALKVGQK